MRLLRGAEDFDGSVPFAARLGRLVVETSLNARHRTALRRSRERNTPVDPASDEEMPESERAERLRRFVAELPDELKTPIELRFFAGLSRKETAERLGVSEGLVAVRVHRGKQRLRLRLGQAGVIIALAELDSHLMAAAEVAAAPSAVGAAGGMATAAWWMAALVIPLLSAWLAWSMLRPGPAAATAATPVIAKLEPAPAVVATEPLAAAPVDGVMLVHDAVFGYVQIVAPRPDHNVVSVVADRAAGRYRITVNGRTAEVPSASLLAVRYRGGPGGYDRVSGTSEAVLYGGHNQVSGSSFATLFGDDNVVDGTRGSVQCTIYGGARNAYHGDVRFTDRLPAAEATAIPGVFTVSTASFTQLWIVSPRAQGNTVAFEPGSAAGTWTVTENGVAATIRLAKRPITVIYSGSWNGSDDVRLSYATRADLYGSGNRLTLGSSTCDVGVDGDGNVISAIGSRGHLFIHGANETVTGGLDQLLRGSAPVIATACAPESSLAVAR